MKQLVANPPKPLTFRAAILESEAAALPGSGLANWQALVAEVGCTAALSQIDCVRAVPAATIKNTIEQQSLAFAPVSDQVTASSDVRSNFITHKAAQVPLFFGSNSQEGRVFAAAAGLDTPNPPITSAQFLNATFPGQPAFQVAIAAAYPADVVAVPYLLASAVITDATFTCPISALSTLARLSGYDVWRYYFNAQFPQHATLPQRRRLPRQRDPRGLRHVPDRGRDGTGDQPQRVHAEGLGAFREAPRYWHPMAGTGYQPRRGAGGSGWEWD